jgi:hypothetical protein
MNRFDRLLNWTQELSQSLSAFVSHYGMAEAIAFNSGSPAIAISDFFHYCIAKGSKHIRAALVLVDHGLPEDAMIVQRILRTFAFRVGGFRPGSQAATSCFSGFSSGSMTK